MTTLETQEKLFVICIMTILMVNHGDPLVGCLSGNVLMLRYSAREREKKEGETIARFIRNALLCI